ncbi:MAG: hypothetical protein Q8M88_14440, partial [Phenylobacterium sp.]|uniref:hypothetical protein n=1 Tax=Phenylobacterium sp. TaxID=1871053 RepID=UPI0027361D10
AALAALATGAAGAQAWIAAGVLALASGALCFVVYASCATAARAWRTAVDDYAEAEVLIPTHER